MVDSERADRYRRRAFAMRKALTDFRRGERSVQELVSGLYRVLLRLTQENAALNDNLTSVQGRCTELLEENRRLRCSLSTQKQP